MLTEFGKIFAFFIVAILFVSASFIAARIIRPNRKTREKQIPYECGENPEGTPWVKFNVRFYVIALLFLIFDVEIVLLLPWAAVYQDAGLAGFAAGFFFLLLLVAGLLYEWRKGDLNWTDYRVNTRLRDSDNKKSAA